MSTHITDATSLDAEWVTSTYSGGNSNCLQAAALPHGNLAVRDSKRPAGPALVIPAAGWHAFLEVVRSQEFDTN